MQSSDGSRPTSWPFWNAGRAPAQQLRPTDTVAVRLLLGCLRGYKLLISPLVAGYCRFHPSCADYAREAIAQHGAVRGTRLTLTRLAQCRPGGRHGYDPVPPR